MGLVENEVYDAGIDMWSVGCIVAEFLGRKALFPGRDYLQQLRLIIDVLGTPSDSDLKIIDNKQAVEYIKSLPKREKVPFSKLYPKASPEAVDMVDKLLKFNPAERLTADQALKHPYMEALHNVNDEPTATKFKFDFEKDDITEDELRVLIWNQLKDSHTELGDP